MWLKLIDATDTDGPFEVADEGQAKAMLDSGAYEQADPIETDEN